MQGVGILRAGNANLHAAGSAAVFFNRLDAQQLKRMPLAGDVGLRVEHSGICKTASSDSLRNRELLARYGIHQKLNAGIGISQRFPTHCVSSFLISGIRTDARILVPQGAAAA